MDSETVAEQQLWVTSDSPLLGPSLSTEEGWGLGLPGQADHGPSRPQRPLTQRGYSGRVSCLGLPNLPRDSTGHLITPQQAVLVIDIR